jgi:hypothetical protein
MIVSTTVVAESSFFTPQAAYSLSGLAALAVAEDDLPRATELLAAADALFDQLGTTRMPFISDLDASSEPPPSRPWERTSLRMRARRPGTKRSMNSRRAPRSQPPQPEARFRSLAA